jgi:hypothetical protein
MHVYTYIYIPRWCTRVYLREGKSAEEPSTTNIVDACISTTVMVGGTPEAEKAMKRKGTVSTTAISIIVDWVEKGWVCVC